jgi:hypothetical protein
VLCGLKQGDDLISTDGVAYGIERLRHEFPLQARIEAADPASRTAYAMVLQTWLENGAAPRPYIIPLFSLNKLLELDALVTTESGLGCYPFSAEKTGISVEYGTHRVNAMCAVDALAIPFLAQVPAIITATCGSCAAPLTIHLDAGGQGTRCEPDGVKVVYRKLAQQHVACSNDLCPGIVFVCADCATDMNEDCLSVADAAAVGQLFFGFQKKLIR